MAPAGGVDTHRERLITGMLGRGHSQAFADQVVNWACSFSGYGFPESHSASFALITYATCWLKCRQPAAFAASLINSQPMGFYTPDQILQDARRRGVAVFPVDVRFSGWDCALEGDTLATNPNPSIRMGLRMITEFVEATALRIESARTQRAYTDVEDLCRRADLDRRDQNLLADAGALRGITGHRHRARWAIQGVEAQKPLSDDIGPTQEIRITLPPPSVS